MSKYGNKKTVVDGITFDSIKESERYFFLKHDKNIRNLKLQPKFELHEAFEVDTLQSDGTIKKTRERAICYVADFEYDEGDWHVVEDVKGWKTQVYKLKRKLFIKKYPKILFRET